MARLYETKMEQFRRELVDFYADRESVDAPVPPLSTPRRSPNIPPGGYVTNEDLVAFPRYQTPQQAVRKQVEEFKRVYRRIKSTTGATH